MRNLFVALWLVLLAGHASAHAFLKSTSPAAGSTVSSAPTDVVIDFTEAVEPSFSTITVQNAKGERLAIGRVHRAGDETHLAIAVKPLPAGTYTVVWHVTATDTHKTQGSFTFTVAPR